MRCPITISVTIQVKPCAKSLHFDISSGKKKRERRKNNFTSPAPKPKQKPIAKKTVKKSDSDPFADLYEDSPVKKETLTQKADKVVVPAIEKTKPILQRLSEIFNPPMEKAEKQMASQGFKINKGPIKSGIYGAGTKALEVASAPGYAITNTFYQALVNKDLNAAKSLWKGPQ
jgi:hypothetical protein